MKNNVFGPRLSPMGDDFRTFLYYPLMNRMGTHFINRSERKKNGFKKTARFFVLILICIVLGVAPARGEEIGLAQALEIFYKKNYDLLIGKFDIEKAYADFVGAKLYPNPNLSVNHFGNEFSKGYPQLGDNTQSTVRLDQLIELGGRRQLRIDSTQETHVSAELAQKDKIRNLLSGFYSVWYNLLLDRLNVEFAKKELERIDKVLKVGEIRFKAGTLTLIDHAKLKLSRIDAQTALATFENQYRNHVEDFNFLLGAEKTVEPASRFEYPEQPKSFSEGELLGVAYQNRYDYLSLQRQLRASDLDVAFAKSYKIPDITVGAEYDQFGTKITPNFGAGISLRLPILNKNQGEIMKRMAGHGQIEIQIEKTRRQIVSDVRQAVNNYDSALKIENSYAERKKEMEDLLKNSQAAFALGGITVLDFIDAQRTYRDFSTKHNQARMQVLLSRELVRVATGEIK
ncbi:MAG: TolC family protein [Nitrospinae bacterium]|nr:TolC family protein [Nitrospinota bacterium]